MNWTDIRNTFSIPKAYLLSYSSSEFFPRTGIEWSGNDLSHGNLYLSSILTGENRPFYRIILKLRTLVPMKNNQQTNGII